MQSILMSLQTLPALPFDVHSLREKNKDWLASMMTIQEPESFD